MQQHWTIWQVNARDFQNGNVAVWGPCLSGSVLSPLDLALVVVSFILGVHPLNSSSAWSEKRTLAAPSREESLRRHWRMGSSFAHYMVRFPWQSAVKSLQKPEEDSK